MKLAYIYELLGEREKAWSNYERAAILEPQNVSTLFKMADYKLYQLDFSQALKEYEQALLVASIDSDRIGVYKKLAMYFDLLGQPKKALEYIKLLRQTAAMSQSKLNRFFIGISNLDAYVKADQIQQARNILQTVVNEVKPPFDIMAALGNLMFYLSMQEDNENLSTWILQLEQGLEQLDSGSRRGIREILPILQTQIAELQGDYKKAEMFLSKFILSPVGNDNQLITLAGRIYRKSAQLEKAEQYLLSALARLPYYADIHYELALVYEQKNNKEKTLHYLSSALDIWKNAEADFKKARLTQEKYDQLQQ